MEQLSTSNNLKTKFFLLNSSISDILFEIELLEDLPEQSKHDKTQLDTKQYEKSIRQLKQHLHSIQSNNPNRHLDKAIQVLSTKINTYTNQLEKRLLSNTNIRFLPSPQEDSILHDIFFSAKDLKQFVSFERIQLYQQTEKKINLIQYVMLGFTLLIIGFTLYRTYKLIGEVEENQRIQEVLRIAELDAKKSVMLKEKFMANMSHEIRTPLNAIIGFTKRLDKTPTTNQQRQFLDVIQSSSSNLLRIVNDILDFSKIEADMLLIEKIPFFLPKLMKTLKTFFDDKAAEKNITFQILKENSVPNYLIGDQNRLYQILLNLLNNAIKFTEQGSIQLHIHQKEIIENTCILIFEIHDTGIGIPEHKLQSIFERFEQVDIDTTRKYGGTGLGLSIVKQLVHLMHGHISLESKLHKGSIFKIEIPFHLSSQHEHDDYHLNIQELNTFVTEVKDKVLIVEDNPLNAELLTYLLQDFNLAYDLAENGKIALQKLKEQSYKLIFLDIQMPEMNGYDTAYAIRNQLQLDVPIIAITAHALEDEKEKCLKLGVNEYITKPIDEELLISLIKKHSSIIETHHASVGHTKQILNLNYLNTILKNNEDLIQKVLQTYSSEVPKFLSRLEMGIRQEQYDEIFFCVHRLIASIGFVGLPEKIKYSMEKIEQDAKNKENIHHIKSEYATISPALYQSIEEVKERLR
ncbi:MAG: ATP-binding protein [Chitinophagaceae bacterium]